MQFRSSADARRYGAPLVRLFVTGLARPPERWELALPVARMRAGDDLGDFAFAMAGSAEFVSRHGPDGPPDGRYLQALFQAATGSPPPPAEAERLLRQPGATRASLLVEVSQSDAVRAAVTLASHLYGGALPPGDDLAYQLWLEAGGEQSLAFAGEMPATGVSVVIAAGVGRLDLLAETIHSLLAQTSPHWQAIVVRGELPPGVGDPRITALDDAGPGTDGLNRAVAAAAGALVAFVEAGDRLAPQAVEAAARRLAAQPGLRLIYTDEDSVAGDGTRFGVSLKPAPSPDWILNGDVLGQLALFARARVVECGGLSAEAGAFARYDLALRVMAGAGPDEVAHQPGILFHRGRARSGRPAPFPQSRAGNGLPALDAAIDRFLRQDRPGLRRGSARLSRPGNSDPELDSQPWPTLHAALPSPAPRVSAIVLTRDHPELLEPCLAGLLDGTDYPDLEVILVDNGSTDADALAILARAAADPRVRVLRDRAAFNWSALNNRAAAAATGDVLLLLNNDVTPIEPGWLRRMAAHAMRPGIGVVGARLLFPDGRLQHGGFLLGPRGAGVHAYTGALPDQPGYGAQVAVLRDLSAVTGACLAIRRSVFDRLGGLEAEHLAVAWSDVDLCLRARESGLRVVWDPAATLVHHETATRGRDHTLEQQARFEAERAYMRRRWPEATERDPFLPPALRADPDQLVFRSVTPPDALPTVPGDWAGAADVYRELVALRQALAAARTEVADLHRLWPRMELQRLGRALAAATAAGAAAAAERDAAVAELAARPPGVIDVSARFAGVVRAWQVLRRLVAVVRRTPGRRALLRQRRADRAAIAGSPVFDRAWYRATAMDGDKVTDPVLHYLWRGSVTGYAPHPLFDAAWYRAQCPELGQEDPFAHYCRRGMAEDRDPHPLFETAYYLAQAPEAAGRALLHHSSLPAHDTRSPARLFDPVDYPQGLAHWAQHGAAAELDPHALFSTAWYRLTVLGGDRGRNPLAHWLREGRHAGLPTNPYGLQPASGRLLVAVPDAAVAVSVLAAHGRLATETTRTLLAIAQNTPPGAFEVILVGPGPTPALGDGLRAAPDLRCAASLSRGRFLAVLGAGAVVGAGWLDPLLRTAEQDERAGCVGARTLAADGTLRSAGAAVAANGAVRFAGGGDPALPEHAFAREVDAVDPGAMLLRRDAWDEAGGLHDGYETAAYAAADLAFALRARGWRVLLQPGSTVVLPGEPAGSEADRRHLRGRWAPALSAHPAEADPLGAWRAAAKRVLVLVDAVPPAEGSPVAAAVGRVGPGTRVVLHAPGSAAEPGAAAGWERRGVEMVRSPVLLDDWLARCGAELDEVWCFGAPDRMPVAALLRATGAELLRGGEDGTLSRWGGRAVPPPPSSESARAAA